VKDSIGTVLLTSEPERSVVVLADFDGVTYRITTTEDKTTLLVSMGMSCFKELESYGAAQVLAREYGAYYQSTPESGYDVTLKIDLQSLPADTGTYY
jgi:actin related protein 2/3 complex, subunit 2